ncbi:MAG: hypothetical protein NC930_04190, partial [Candidatus Omnitrophica bacterium]|nr:hypothetical protein [Candidatus Omnitrophota bacterium]
GANGNVTLESMAKVIGHVTHSGILSLGASASVGSSSVGSSIVAPKLFGGLMLPAASIFTAGGTDVIKGDIQSTTLAPGTYGDLTLGNNNALNLGSGAYYFDKIIAGDNLTLTVDLSGGDLLLYILGNVNFGMNLNFSLINGTADNIYLESLGSFALHANSKWYGTVYTPYGNLTVGPTSDILGSLYSGGQIEIKRIVSLERHLSSHFNDDGQNDDQDNGVTVIPEPYSIATLLTGVSLIYVSGRNKKPKSQ